MFNPSSLINEMPQLYRFALRLTRNNSDADDLLQSTVLRALEKKHLFTEGTSLFKWCSKIMFNLFATDYRHKIRFETQYDPAIYAETEAIEPTQDDIVDLENVRTAIHNLSTDHQQILTLVCMRDMRYEEVSQQLQIPVGTVRSRLSRARENLQVILNTPLPRHMEAA